MVAIKPDPQRIKSFPNQQAFERWLKTHHASATELWLKIHKKGSGLASVTNEEAIDSAICWGWIDGLRKSFDEQSFLQRFTPRQSRSVWSQINRTRVERLTQAGRMTAHGQRHIDAAKADGRWDAAYAPIRNAQVSDLPADLSAAIDANAKARRMLATLNRFNLFALMFRTNNMKTAAGRARKIAALVEQLARGETIVPQPAEKQAVKAKAKRRPNAKRKT
jgi:uncharacterized protein YdeI (YjbR/CyaY-like superfamily)